MVVAKQIFKVDIDPAVADAIREALDKRKISYTAGAESLFRWFVSQDGMLQAMILGQIEEEHESQIAEMILAKILDKKREGRGFKSAARPR